MTELLLDSASLYYRSYFALPESITAPDGRPVNAVRGFLDTIAALVSERRPRQVTACWDDDWRPQWRVDLVASYKTHRLAPTTEGAAVAEEVPDTLGPQVDILRELLPLLGVAVVGAPECEADDIIATLAHDRPVDIASGDRDLLQLVSPTSTVLFTGGTNKSRGGRPWVEFTPEQVVETYGVPPKHYADLAILRGDPSDGLPGIKGIGDKTAVALIRAFGGLADIVAAATSGAPPPMTPAVRARIMQSRDELGRLDRVVRLSPRDGVCAPPRAAIDPAGLAMAESLGVARSAKRLVDALESVHP